MLTPPLGKGLYPGGSLEAGRQCDVIEPLNPSETRYGGSLFFGADTWLGPFFVGFGVSGEGETTGYITLGRPSRTRPAASPVLSRYCLGCGIEGRLLAGVPRSQRPHQPHHRQLVHPFRQFPPCYRKAAGTIHYGSSEHSKPPQAAIRLQTSHHSRSGHRGRRQSGDSVAW
jgi:hypothetical protein